jgi:hypothetical protein
MILKVVREKGQVIYKGREKLIISQQPPPKRETHTHTHTHTHTERERDRERERERDRERERENTPSKTNHFKAYYFKVVFYIINPELHH